MIAMMLASALLMQTEELAEAAKKSAALESYAFKLDVKSAKGKNQPGAIEGRYQKDQPLALKTGSTEGFRKGSQVVTKDGEGWKRHENAKSERKLPAAGFALLKPPHEELEGFEKSFEKVEKAAEKDKECTVWSGTLTPTAARILVSSRGKADIKSNATYAGTAKVWVNDQGLIVRYEVVSQMKGSTAKGDVETTITKIVEITEPGATKVEVPEGAAKLLNSQS